MRDPGGILDTKLRRVRIAQRWQALAERRRGRAVYGLYVALARTPSFFVHLTAPWFREFARLGILVLLSVAVLAAFGIRRLQVAAVE